MGVTSRISPGYLHEISTKALNYPAVALFMMQDSIRTFHPMLEVLNGVHTDGHNYIGGERGRCVLFSE